ncbi:histidinol-phosphatase HisJ [Litchfieldia salsa]|uniref:Histidinol-phosphatase n=1 Tax=Litchfieldia salsa TaxID=930152 RepID=A0A1H0P632_9BACI|nr:histidinol-phosphatase HisJ [Litchfieldia salsa]SDP00150.1 histidinol-phosphatase (PHP family) [Litchfieldia salsa]
MKRDGHIHSPFCPHGTKDDFEEYIERAIRLNYDEISFTEHAPLPHGFDDPTPDKDSGMDPTNLEPYIARLSELKKKYKTQIRINIGLEVDFIKGYEKEITQFLNEYGPFLDDSILSVHFLEHEGKYDCVDFSASVFEEMTKRYSSVDAIYERYYNTLNQSIIADLGTFKPRRIGHITLVHKFQKLFKPEKDYSSMLFTILTNIKESGLQLDYNGAGVKKEYCEEPYPPEWIVKEAIKQKIPLVYGSDAHSAKDLEQGFEFLHATHLFTSPTKF